MLRSTCVRAMVLALASAALGQSDASAKVPPISKPAKDARVQHVATGTAPSLAVQLTPDEDLAGPAGQSHEGSADLDDFDVSFLESQTDAPGNGGMLLGGERIDQFLGDPGGEDGDGTICFGDSLPGTGIQVDDVFATVLGKAFAGCGFFGGHFSRSADSTPYHQLWGDAQSMSTGPGIVYCTCNGVNVNSPCGNVNDGSLGMAGCANSNNDGGGMLRAVVTPSNDIEFLAMNCAPNRPGLFFQADHAINGGNGVPFGDGLRCAGGGVVRLGVRTTDSNGCTSFVGVPNPGPGLTKRYQFWYRNDNVSVCGSGFNFSNCRVNPTVSWA